MCRSLFLTVLLSAGAFIEGFYLWAYRVRSVWRHYRDHDNASNRMDADVLGWHRRHQNDRAAKWAKRSPREVRESTALSVHDG